MPVVFANLPAWQSEQFADTLLLAYDPAAQDVQLEVPFEAANLPSSQATQSAGFFDAVPVKKVPTGQAVHTAVPSTFE